jgi:hypothetical protein
MNGRYPVYSYRSLKSTALKEELCISGLLSTGSQSDLKVASCDMRRILDSFIDVDDHFVTCAEQETRAQAFDGGYDHVTKTA